MNATTAAPSATEEALQSHREHLFQCVTPYYKEPIVLEEGEGVRVGGCVVGAAPFVFAVSGMDERAVLLDGVVG